MSSKSKFERLLDECGITNGSLIDSSDDDCGPENNTLKSLETYAHIEFPVDPDQENVSHYNEDETDLTTTPNMYAFTPNSCQNLNANLNQETGFDPDFENTLQPNSLSCNTSKPSTSTIISENYSQRRKTKLNPMTGLIESDSEDSLDLNTTQNISAKKLKLNHETGLFDTDTDDTSDESSDTKPNTGKKRKSRPETWKHNVAVKKNLQDHTIREIQDCRCKCKEKLSPSDIATIFNKFINLSSHTEQNIYLQGCLQEQMPVRFRPRKKKVDATYKNRRVFKYFLTLSTNKSIEVCQQAFLATHGIKRDRLQAKVQHPEKNIIDGRGRNPSKGCAEDTIRKIHAFIESVPARASHYCRSSSKHRKYLDSHLSISALHREFLKQNVDLDCSYEKFRQIFNIDFNISFATPRKDICRTCEKYAMDIQSAEIDKNRQILKKLTLEREIHLRKADVFLKSYSESEKEKDETKMSITFDYQKNLPLPVTNVSDEYYLRQLWLHNFGIHNLKDNTASMYMYTENYAKKGPNEVLSALNDYIDTNRTPQQKELEIFCDNCFSQNKNRYLFTYLDQLCAKGIFHKITVMYPIPGHSMMPIDRDFALIERKRLKHEKVYSPDSYVKMVKDSRINNKFEVVFLEKNLSEDDQGRVIKVQDYKKLYDGNVKPTVPGISQCRRMIFTTYSKPEMSQSMTGDNFTSVRLYRVGLQRVIRSPLEDCYRAMVKVKDAKIADIQKLLRFIPENNRAFYLEMIEEMALLNEANENDSFDEVE